MKRPAPPPEGIGEAADPFDMQLLAAIDSVKSASFYRVMLPWDSYRHGNGYANTKARKGLELKHTKKGLYWFAFRYRGSRKRRETIARRCSDDHHPGGPSDTVYHLLCKWVNGEEVEGLTTGAPFPID